MTNTQNVLEIADHARMLNGIEWLNAHYPNWYNEIDLSVFDIIDGQRCVIGQIWGGGYFNDAIRTAWEDTGYEYYLDDDETVYSWAHDRGFDGYRDTPDAANFAWTRCILAHRAR